MRNNFDSYDSYENARAGSHAYAGEGRMLGELSARTYNLILGGTLTWGFLINAVICLFFSDAVFAIPPTVLLFGYLISAVVGVTMSARSSSPVVSFIGYNLVVLPLGAVLTVLVSAYDADVVLLTMLVTTIVVLGITVLSSLFPRFFLSMASTLGITLLLVLIANFVCALIGLAPAWLDWVVTLLFCGYIGFDYARAQTKLRTVDNAIDSACELYVDIVNVFIRLLAIMSRSSKRR